MNHDVCVVVFLNDWSNIDDALSRAADLAGDVERLRVCSCCSVVLLFSVLSLSSSIFRELLFIAWFSPSFFSPSCPLLSPGRVPS